MLFACANRELYISSNEAFAHLCSLTAILAGVLLKWKKIFGVALIAYFY